MDDELSDIRKNRPVGIDVGTWLPEPCQVSLSGVAGSLFEAIVAVLITITRAAPQKEAARLRSELERLVLWGGSFSLSDGRLDELLSRSSELRHAILSALCELGKVVKDDLQPALVGEQKDCSASPSHTTEDLQLLLEKAASVLDVSDETLSDDGSLRSDVDEIFEDLALYIDCLMDLSPALDSPILDPELDRPLHRHIETFNVSSSQAQVFCRHVRDRFPKMAKFLVERLGEANAVRADRLKAIRDRATEPRAVSTHALRNLLDGTSKQAHSDNGPKMTASSAYSTHLTESVFDEPHSTAKDKAFGDDCSITTFATNSTSVSTLQKHRPRVPPLPNEAAEGKPFKCLICHYHLARINTRAAWKKHVFDDLQPYVCTIQECTKPRTRFQSSLEWANHEATHINNRANTKCPICVGDKDLSEPAGYFKHIAEHMREIALAVLPPNLEADEDDSDGVDEFFSAPEEMSKSHWMVPFERNAGFVGRNSILDRVMDKMKISFESRSCQVVSLFGPVGIGKTQAALEAVYRMQEQVSGCSVFWVSARDGKAIEHAYREIGQRLQVANIDEDGVDTQRLVNAALSEKSGQWIMVIDGAGDIDTPKDTDVPFDLPLPTQGNGIILITTRNRSVADHLGDVVIEVGGMDRADTLKLLESGLSSLQLDDVAATDKMQDLLQGNPFSVQRALSYMTINGVTPTEYVPLFKSAKVDMSEVRVEITIELLEEQNPETFKYLKLLALMGDSQIPDTLLPLDMKVAKEEAIEALEKAGLVSTKPDKAVHVHRLVRPVIKPSLDSDGELGDLVTKLILRLVEVYPSPEYDNRAAWILYLSHAESVLHFEEKCTDKHATAELLFKVGVSLYILGDYPNAEKYITQSFDLKLHSDSRDPDILTTGNYLGNLRLQLGWVTAAEELENTLKSLLVSCLEQNPPESPDSIHLQSCNNLALKLDHEGKYADAETLHRSSLETYQRLYCDQNIDKFRCMNNLASVLKSQEKYDEALSFYQKALAGFKALLGPDHPDTLMSMNNLAVLNTSQGDYAAAESISQDVFTRLKAALGDEHPNTLIAMKNLADILWERDQVANAENLYAQALVGLEKILGPAHPWTRSCEEGLAACRALQSYVQPITIPRALGRVPIIKMPKAAGGRLGGERRASNDF